MPERATTGSLLCHHSVHALGKMPINGASNLWHRKFSKIMENMASNGGLSSQALAGAERRTGAE